MGSCPPHCVEMAFAKLADGKGCINAADLASFLTSTQGELSANEDYAASLITQFRQISKASSSSSDSLYIHEFLELLLHPELNSLMQASDKPTQDMTAPLSHYFIYTSHNSYLTGNQLTSRSDTALIEKALQAGCRVVELDCWDRKGAIMVLHGHTLTKPVPFDECLRAIKQNAFLSSDYPVIITIENHLPLDLQKEAAKIIRDILGEMLFVPSLAERPPRRFASPEELKHKIIISDTPPKEPLQEQAAADPEAVVDAFPYLMSCPPGLEEDDSPPLSPTALRYQAKEELTRQIGLAADALTKRGTASHKDGQLPPRAPELEELIYIFCEKPSQMQDAPVHGVLVPGERSIMANVSEAQLRKLVKKNADSLIKYTKNNLGRMYPFGLRFNSSNPDPFLAWAHGFQLAALNIQGQDRPCWMAQALFDGNGGCGFVKKPQIFLPKSEMSYEQIANIAPKLLLKVKVLMGTDWHNINDLLKQPNFYIKFALDGLPSDKARKKTDIIHKSKSDKPDWEHHLFEFPIRVPEIAVLRLEVWEHHRLQHDGFTGQACFSVRQMKTGIRVVTLQSRSGEPLQSKLLCWIQMEDLAEPEC